MQDNTKKTKIIIGIFLVVVLIILAYIFIFEKHVSHISLNTQYIRIYEGEKFTLEASVDEVVWKSTNPGVALVSSDGLVEGVSVGDAKIIVSTKDGNVSNSCVVVVVKKEIESFQLDNRELVLSIGEEKELKPIIIPEDLTGEHITWESSNSSIISVDNNGKVVALKNGIAEVKASLLGKVANSTIFVGTKIDSIKLDKNEYDLELEKNIKLNVSILPDNAIDEKIIWESSDPNVVKVDDDGNIEGKNIGNAQITATTEYSKIKDICYVKVTGKKYEIKYTELDKIVMVKEGDTLGEVPTMTKDDYIFLGWYDNATGGNKVNSNTVVTSNMTLYPHWEIKETYTIGPGEGIYSKTVTYMGRTFKDYKQNRINYSYHGNTVPAGGCGPVSLMDIISGYQDVKIEDVVKITGLSTSFHYINMAAASFGFQHSDFVSYNSGSFNESAIAKNTAIAIDHLKKGHQLIALVSGWGGHKCPGLVWNEYSYGNHFIAIVAVKKDNENVIVLNPSEGRREEGRMSDIIRCFMPSGGKGFYAYWK